MTTTFDPVAFKATTRAQWEQPRRPGTAGAPPSRTGSVPPPA